MRTRARPMSQIALRLPAGLIAALDNLARHYNANRGRGSCLQPSVTRSQLMREALTAAVTASQNTSVPKQRGKHRAA